MDDVQKMLSAFRNLPLHLFRCFGNAKTLRLALLHHLQARSSSCRGDFRSALVEEKEAYNIYKSLVFLMTFNPIAFSNFLVGC